MQIKDVLKTVAPTIANLLGGPLAGLAVEAVGSAFGWTDTTKEKVEAVVTGGNLSGEQIAQLRQAEVAIKVRLRELDIQEEGLEVDDRKSARQAAVESKSYTPSMLSWLVVLGYFLVTGYLIVEGNPAKLDDLLLGRLLGTLDMAFGTVLAFWLGTSFSSRSKDAALAAAAKS